MCFSRSCPAEDWHTGECTCGIGPFPCEAEEVFAEERDELEEEGEEESQI